MLGVEMLAEPVNVPDVYVSGLAYVEDLGDGNYRLTLYTTRASVYGGTEHTVECRLIMTNAAILESVKTMLTKLGARCSGAALGALRH